MKLLLLTVLVIPFSCSSNSYYTSYDSLSGDWQPSMSTPEPKVSRERAFQVKFNSKGGNKYINELFENEETWNKIRKVYNGNEYTSCGTVKTISKRFIVGKEDEETDTEYKIIKMAGSDCSDGKEYFIYSAKDQLIKPNSDIDLDDYEYRLIIVCHGKVLDGKAEGKHYCLKTMHHYNIEKKELQTKTVTREVTFYKNGLIDQFQVTARRKEIVGSYTKEPLRGAAIPNVELVAKNTTQYDLHLRNYRAGLYHGEHTTYLDGLIFSRNTYKNGMSHGKHQRWDLDGNLVSDYIFVNNVIDRKSGLKTIYARDKRNEKKQEELHQNDGWSVD